MCDVGRGGHGRRGGWHDRRAGVRAGGLGQRGQGDSGSQGGRHGGSGSATGGVLGNGRAGSQDSQEDVGKVHLEDVIGRIRLARLTIESLVFEECGGRKWLVVSGVKSETLREASFEEGGSEWLVKAIVNEVTMGRKDGGKQPERVGSG